MTTQCSKLSIKERERAWQKLHGFLDLALEDHVASYPPTPYVEAVQRPAQGRGPELPSLDGGVVSFGRTHGSENIVADIFRKYSLSQ